jgi:DNA-binding MarR family transcriptional regulator
VIETDRDYAHAVLRSERKRREPDIAILAAQLLFSVQEELFATLAERGHPDVRPRHGAVLAHVDESGARATDLAHQSGVNKQSMVRLVDELEALGYVERRPDPRDRRAKLVVPTRLGLDEMNASDEIVAGIEARIAAGIGARPFASLKRSLLKVTALTRSGVPG